MTIGALSRRTGVAVKTLREYEDMGLIYTAGRTPGNYRLFDDDAMWCVGVVSNLRGLGLTLAEIQALAGTYLRPGDEPVGPRMASVLRAVRTRIEERIADQQATLQRIAEFEAGNQAELNGRADCCWAVPRMRRWMLVGGAGGVGYELLPAKSAHLKEIRGRRARARRGPLNWLSCTQSASGCQSISTAGSTSPRWRLRPRPVRQH